MAAQTLPELPIDVAVLSHSTEELEQTVPFRRGSKTRTPQSSNESTVSWMGVNDEKHSKPPRNPPIVLQPDHPNLRRAAIQLAFIAAGSLIIFFVLIAHPPTSKHGERAHRVFYAPVAMSPHALRPNETQGRRGGEPFLPLHVLDSSKFTRRQCQAAFPRFQSELELSTRFWRSRGGIKEEAVHEAGSRRSGTALIRDGRLYVKGFREGRDYTRAMAVLGSIHEAILTAPEPVPNIEFSLDLSDATTHDDSEPTWTLTRSSAEEGSWLVPDPGFWSETDEPSKSWRRYRSSTVMSEASDHFERKEGKLYWRGPAATTESQRGFLSESRLLGDWTDVAVIDDTSADGGHLQEEYCNHKYIASAEGSGFAHDLKYLLACRSVVVTNELEWGQHYHVALDSTPGSRNQNVVVVHGKNWEGLQDSLRWLRENPKQAELIAENAFRDFAMRYLSPAATSCWWRMAFDAYAHAQTFESHVGDDAMDWERFVLLRR